MNTIFRMMATGLALGIFGSPVGPTGWVKAQETTSGGNLLQHSSAPSEEPAPESNGALPSDSHVRIVRLSDVKGSLALDRKTGHGFEQTMQNMPIVEGEKLKTEEGYAEVEFEDSSTLRLTPNSQVDFSLLALRSSGAKASTMNLIHGTVYVTLESTKANEFELRTGKTKLLVTPSTHLRLEVNGSKTEVSVFSGSVQVQRDSETTLVGKKESLTLDSDLATVAKKISGEPYDAWDKESNEYHARYSRANAFAGSGNTFGLSDLNYYGSFTNTGFGQIWQPYFAGAGWSPYCNGLWALYPGAGYSWVSPYPWGWLPYHSGTWNYYPTYGWGWQPGGNWNGLNNVPAGGTQVTGTSASPLRSPLRPAPPQVPATGARPSLLLANQSQLVFSKEDKAGNFVFQRESAGLGVPRGTLGSLNKIASHVEQHGSASMPVYSVATGGQAGAGGHDVSRGPVVLRPGSTSFASRGTEGVSSATTAGQTSRASGSQSASAYHGAGGSAPTGSGATGGSGGHAASPK